MGGSRQRLSDLLLKKKQTKPSKPAAAAVVDTSVEEVPQLIKAESVVRESIARPTASASVARESVARESVARESVARESVARESVARESVDESVNKETPSVRGRRPGAPNGNNDEPLNKTQIIKLLKTSEVQSISSDVIDAVKEVISTVVKDLCEFSKQGQISDEKLSTYIAKFCDDIDRDIPSSTVILPASFELFVKPLFEENGCSLKRTSYHFFQQFMEYFIIKMMSGADMVSGVAKRQRVTSVDLLVALHIYML
jgi:histone H3/H4